MEFERLFKRRFVLIGGFCVNSLLIWESFRCWDTSFSPNCCTVSSITLFKSIFWGYMYIKLLIKSMTTLHLYEAKELAKWVTIWTHVASISFHFPAPLIFLFIITRVEGKFRGVRRRFILVGEPESSLNLHNSTSSLTIFRNVYVEVIIQCPDYDGINTLHSILFYWTAHFI